MTEQERLRWKRVGVIVKFTNEFVDQYYTNDALFHNIVEMLSRGVDPYAIIEKLIIERKKLMDQLYKKAL